MNHRLHRIAPVVLLAALLLAPARGEAPPSIEESQNAFTKAVKDAAAKTAERDPRASGIYGGGGYASLLPQIQASVANGREDEARNQITALLAAFPDDDAVQQAGKQFLQALATDRKSREDAAAQKISEVLKKVPDAVNQADKPQDLDNLLLALAYVRERRGIQGEEVQRLSEEANTAFAFVSVWQDYLAQRAAGSVNGAFHTLESLKNNPYTLKVMPRSRLLEMINSLVSKPPVGLPAESGAILAEVKTVDDLAAANVKLQALAKTNPPAVSMIDQNALGYALRIYGQSRAEVLAPQAFSRSYSYNDTTSGAEALRVESMALLYALPRYLKLSGDSLPKADESLKDYIHRIATIAGAAGDWRLLQAILKTAGAAGNSDALQQAANVDLLIAAQDQESAGQYVQAVQSYQLALRNLSPFAPPKLIGERLAAIERDHPEDYVQGSSTPRSNPAPAPTPAPYLPRPGMPSGLPGRNS